MADQLDDRRLDGLFEAGVDEVSYRKQHHYLTLVTNHRSDSKVIWAEQGKDAATLTRFLDELGPARCADLTAVSMDMGPA